MKLPPGLVVPDGMDDDWSKFARKKILDAFLKTKNTHSSKVTQWRGEATLSPFGGAEGRAKNFSLIHRAAAGELKVVQSEALGVWLGSQPPNTPMGCSACSRVLSTLRSRKLRGISWHMAVVVSSQSHDFPKTAEISKQYVVP